MNSKIEPTAEQLETKIDELKYHFDEDFGRAVARKEKEMCAYKYQRDNPKEEIIAEEFKKHLALKGFESVLRVRKYPNAPYELWVDLTFNY